MSNSDDKDDNPAGIAKPIAGSVAAFPYSRVAPSRLTDPDSPATYGAMASLFGIPHEQTTGHWCSFCRKIWYGYLLEVACPVCGNRHG